LPLVHDPPASEDFRAVSFAEDDGEISRVILMEVVATGANICESWRRRRRRRRRRDRACGVRGHDVTDSLALKKGFFYYFPAASVSHFCHLGESKEFILVYTHNIRNTHTKSIKEMPNCTAGPPTQHAVDYFAPLCLIWLPCNVDAARSVSFWVHFQPVSCK